MSTDILDSIDSPKDLKHLSYEELDRLAFEIRAKLVATTSVTGGHLAPSLGAVELIIALHRVLDCPKDRLVFDVGHQAYAHKLLTGRRDRFTTLRTYGGISGFPKIDESPYDAHNSGHASDSLSVACGYALARDLDESDAHVAALIGDASFVGGMSMEALNNIGHKHTQLLIVLNDNGMSISPSVGGLAAHLAKARMSRTYVTARNSLEDAMNASGKMGRLLVKSGNVVKESVKQFVLPGDTFLESFGLTYIGPVDGHDIPTLEQIFSDALEMEGPVVVHAVTTKGKGYAPAEKHPDLFHGVGPFDIESGKVKKKNGAPSWTSVFSDELIECASDDDDIIAITAAMASGTGLKKFAKKFPERFVDVGISEEHAVGLASSLAQSGKKPVVAIYSTFLQRAFDQMLIDVCLQKQHVVFCLDRAGLVGADGPTHHGAFDLSYLRLMPNMQILAPSSDVELRSALRVALDLEGPVAIRYSRGSAPVEKDTPAPWEYGRAWKRCDGSDAAILATGALVPAALKAAEQLSDAGIHASVYDMRWVKPIDADAVAAAAQTGHIITVEDNTKVGGFGSGVLEVLAALNLHPRVNSLGLPDSFVEQGDVATLHHKLGLDAQGIAASVREGLGR
ncbi:MAG: 1-deoxy-D-xylulose-5-phosphate synthase [Coriobacteriales bacterium]